MCGGIYCDTQLMNIFVDKIIRYSLENIIVDAIKFDTQLRINIVHKVIILTEGNIMWMVHIEIHSLGLLLWIK